MLTCADRDTEYHTMDNATATERFLHTLEETVATESQRHTIIRTDEARHRALHVDGHPRRRRAEDFSAQETVPPQHEPYVTALGALLLQNPKMVAAFVNRWMSWMPLQLRNPAEAFTQVMDSIVTAPVALQLRLEYGYDTTRTRRVVGGELGVLTHWRDEATPDFSCNLAVLERSASEVEGEVSLWQWSVLLSWLVSYSDELFMHGAASDGDAHAHRFHLFHYDAALEGHFDRSYFFVALLQYVFGVELELLATDPDKVVESANTRVAVFVMDAVRAFIADIHTKHPALSALEHPELEQRLRAYAPDADFDDADYIYGVPTAAVYDEPTTFLWLQWAFEDAAWNAHDHGAANLVANLWCAKAHAHLHFSTVILRQWTAALYATHHAAGTGSSRPHQ